MAKVKCEFCGSFILDTESICPQCGATNENHKRYVDGTPKSINQLQHWYRLRRLPPEEVTRFFIGKNVTEPKAFGIYEENGNFIVYKNKSDGSRAIRYEGTDEAYAVNEIYLRLKEEILNQKSRNIEKRSIGNTPAPSVYREYKEPTTNARRNRAAKRMSALAITFFIIVFLPTFIVTLFTSFDLMAFFNREYGYYVTDSNEVFYADGIKCNGGYEWWQYDIKDDEWELYATYNRQKQKPDSFTKDNYELFSSYSDVTRALSIESDKFPIDDAKEYIDAGHHENPSSAYYYYKDDLYYFLDDRYSEYGNTDNTGWYIYNTDLGAWDYFCSEDDKDAVGDDLWYNESDYRAGSTDGGIYGADKYLTTWEPVGFESTSWYQSYESHESAHQEELNDSNDSYDSDSDYDWDSNDSWDSGGTDWDSDW